MMGSMGSISLPTQEAVDHVQAMLQIIADPAKANERFVKLKAALDEMRELHRKNSESEGKLKDREDKVKAREDAIVDAEKRAAQDRADLDRRLSLLKQAMG